MSRSKIVAGNWKMNNTLAEATALVKGVLKTSTPKHKVETIFFPPFPLLHPVSQLISGHAHYALGAQNCSEHASGAYTGEVSAGMLASAGCRYVLTGHSERREYFKETSAQLVKKIRLALDNQLTVIFCFGEKLQERKTGSHFSVVSSQLKEVLGHFSAGELKHVILAYEPVWAIGTGETATPAQ
ncbi:MAG: triose-phosphate isomerase family protein, partial [Bacteroidia bacterium]